MVALMSSTASFLSLMQHESQQEPLAGLRVLQLAKALVMRCLRVYSPLLIMLAPGADDYPKKGCNSGWIEASLLQLSFRPSNVSDGRFFLSAHWSVIG